VRRRVGENERENWKDVEGSEVCEGGVGSEETYNRLSGVISRYMVNADSDRR
jgi:hypothetical protein